MNSFHRISRTERFVATILGRHALARRTPWRGVRLMYGFLKNKSAVNTVLQQTIIKNIYNLSLAVFFPQLVGTVWKSRQETLKVVAQQTNTLEHLRVRDVLQKQDFVTNSVTSLQSHVPQISAKKNLAHQPPRRGAYLEKELLNSILYNPPFGGFGGRDLLSSTINTNLFSNPDQLIFMTSGMTLGRLHSTVRIVQVSPHSIQNHASSTANTLQNKTIKQSSVHINHDTSEKKEVDEKIVERVAKSLSHIQSAISNTNGSSSTNAPTLHFVRNAISPITHEIEREILSEIKGATTSVDSSTNVSPLAVSVFRRHTTVSSSANQNQSSHQVITNRVSGLRFPGQQSHKSDMSEQVQPATKNSSVQKAGLHHNHAITSSDNKVHINTNVRKVSDITHHIVASKKTERRLHVLSQNTFSRSINTRYVNDSQDTKVPLLNAEKTNIIRAHSTALRYPGLIHMDRQSTNHTQPDNSTPEVISREASAKTFNKEVTITSALPSDAPVNVSVLADTVYRLIENRLHIEKEWRGLDR